MMSSLFDIASEDMSAEIPRDLSFAFVSNSSEFINITEVVRAPRRFFHSDQALQTHDRDSAGIELIVFSGVPCVLEEWRWIPTAQPPQTA